MSDLRRPVHAPDLILLGLEELRQAGQLLLHRLESAPLALQALFVLPYLFLAQRHLQVQTVELSLAFLELSDHLLIYACLDALLGFLDLAPQVLDLGALLLEPFEFDSQCPFLGLEVSFSSKQGLLEASKLYLSFQDSLLVCPCRLRL